MLLLFILLGIFTGILINRMADNLPWERAAFATPHCAHCSTPRARIQFSGIVAFLARRDKCQNCGAPLALRAPLVEIATAFLFAFLANRYPFGAYLLLVCFFSAVLVLIAVIDIEHKLILNVVSLPATALAFIVSPILLGGPDATLESIKWNRYWISLLGIVTGYALTLAIYYLGIVFLKLVNRGRAQKINTVAFGMGDVKLAGLLGALIGFPAIFYALIYAILLGGVGAVIAIAFRMLTRRSYSAFMAIPYGPYLILAGGAFLIFGSALLQRIMGT